MEEEEEEDKGENEQEEKVKVEEEEEEELMQESSMREGLCKLSAGQRSR